LSLFKKSSNIVAANAFIEKLNALPIASNVTVNDKEAIEVARTAY